MEVDNLLIYENFQYSGSSNNHIHIKYEFI